MQRRHFNRQAQRGNLLITALLGLVVSSLAGVAIVNAKRDEMTRSAGVGEATALLNMQGGVNILIANAWQTFQAGSPVTYNGVTVTPANVGGTLTWEPTMAQLQGMGVLPSGWTTTTSRATGAAYRVRIVRSPAGCAGTACSVEGRIWSDAPFAVPGVANSTDAKLVGPILAKIGADAGVSLPGSPATVTGYGFTWSTANPVAGQPQGVVMVRVGTAAAAFAQFVRIGDTRDPALQGPLTVAGATNLNSTLNVAGATTVNSTFNVAGASTFNSTVNAAGTITSNTAVGAKDNASACLRAALEANGNIVSRAANCVTRFLINPVDGSAYGTNSAGTVRVAMIGETGQTNTYDGAGTITTQIDGGTGRVSSRNVNPYGTGTAGTSCASNLEGDIVRDADGNGTVVACRGGVWRRPGAQLASQGAACSTPGVMAVDAAQLALICRNGAWRSVNDRVSSVVSIATFSGAGAGTVPAPSCGSGGSPELTVTPLETGADYGGSPPRNRFSMVTTWTGSGWNVSPVLVDANGTRSTTSFTGGAYAFAWLATTICNYGVSN